MSTTKTFSVLISELRSAQPTHCVAAEQLITRTLPKPVGDWRQFDVTMEDKTIVAIKVSGSGVDERTFVTPGEKVGLFSVSVHIGDDAEWFSASTIGAATTCPPVYALLSAMQGNTEDPESDGPFAMNTMRERPKLRLVGA
jgi:hypothetical protein